MSEAKYTRGGMTLTITNTVDGMLEQGGRCGRVLWYSDATLARLGIDRSQDLDEQLAATINEHGTTLLEYIIHHELYTRVLDHGTLIR